MLKIKKITETITSTYYIYQDHFKVKEKNQ